MMLARWPSQPIKSMVWGRQPIIELYFNHFKIAFDIWFTKKIKWSKKAECQFASKKDTLDEEIELLRSQLGSLEQEKKAADDENAFLKVFLQIRIQETLW